MSPIEAFVWGFAGSGAVEIVALYHVFNCEPITIPERYRKVGFWVVRFFVAMLGGGLAVAYEITKPLLAINVGAATPLIIQAFAQGLRPPTPPTEARLPATEENAPPG